jgi:hypothetical protein
MIEGDHGEALEWFAAHAGTSVSWSAIQEFSGSRVRLVTQAKGIFKPAWAPYALSVRQTLNGDYPDKEVEQHHDGRWSYRYHQEGNDPSRRDKWFTNRGLMKCLADGVPVGVLIQARLEGPVSYEVVGLGTVTGWSAGLFTIEGPASRR